LSTKALRFDADIESADRWSDALLDAGAQSVDVADARADTPDEAPVYDEPGEAGSGWPLCRLTALFRSAAELSAASARLAAAGLRLPPFETFDVPDHDWVRATQAQFAPQKIAETLWIVPSWHEPVDPGAINLELDPGLAFGTGSHATTRLCLQWLVCELREGESVLDYGCGSGILAIAACRLGASRVVGTDIDPQALVASRANAERNHVDASFVAVESLMEGEAFDVVVANILANPIIALAPSLARRSPPGGRIVLSGILDAQADAVIEAYAQWFNIRVCESEDGWVALAGTRQIDSGPVRLAGSDLTP
jgi:ribosomal protein L11 methyltransferase